ncbi:nucleotide sugar dehydrogenase [Paenibacillus silvae]|uniref:nucleotide sugar dehydrogenase n=1 Tax=Paenibacillus silvae TaxID=1325358 RepID=UPI0025A24AC9|nr:nucleotide sugar dehydrogenase [Paenibacillus silvae]MDM5278162.1 nucleotide sugar dehydrogenase [Paenibacillus silvae]
MSVENKILNLKANVAVIGLGYVGLPLALNLAEAGYTVTGIDLSVSKVNLLNRGESYISDISNEALRKVNHTERFMASSEFSLIQYADVIIACVPTPLNDYTDPDLSSIYAVVDYLQTYMKKGSLVILESTTYPGCTEEIIQARLEATGLQVGKDFYLCFSPERIDPSNRDFTLNNTPKIVGGVTLKCSNMASELYKKICKDVITVSSPKVAEFTKLLENTFRSVNIAFINEIAMMSEKMGINVWEVIQAASTKPFGFMPFYPGPGIGGHCIPLDPMYLSWKAKYYKFFSRFIELSNSINSGMPDYVVSKLHQLLNQKSLHINKSKILVLGVAYKPEVNDDRESPALELIKLLIDEGAHVDFYDPYVEYIELENGPTLFSVDYDVNAFKQYECCILMTAHKAFRYEELKNLHVPIFDTRNAFSSFDDSHIYKLGAGLLHAAKDQEQEEMLQKITVVQG